MRHWGLFSAAMAVLLAGCDHLTPDSQDTGDNGPGDAVAASNPVADPYPSTYTAYPSEPTLITGVTILTGTGTQIDNGAVLMADGRITAVGEAGRLDVPDGTTVIDGAGKWVTPGIIDIHSHLGVYPSPSNRSTADGNEATSPNTAEVWAEHSVWPQDAGFTRALAGGITSLMILPGSANLFGGRTVTLKNVPSRTVQGMKFPGAPYGIKMACGENPKRVYASRGPATRMGNFSHYRAGWIDALEYKGKWEKYNEKIAKGDDDAKQAEPPKRDLKLETLAGVLNGEIIVHMHCYRADEMVHVLDMAREFGYKVGTFHHGVEAYKVADYLAENDACAAVWADWWGFKLEAYDMVEANAALIDAQEGGCAVIHSDSDTGIQRLNQNAAKAMAAGNRMGFDLEPRDAIAWITANPAKAMGILEQTGTLEAGKMADVVLWSRNPFSVYAKAEKVLY